MTVIDQLNYCFSILNQKFLTFECCGLQTTIQRSLSKLEFGSYQIEFNYDF